MEAFKNNKILSGKTIILFFPDSSIRTRVTFEKGIQELGATTILFPPESLDKKEEIKDVVGYLEQFADAIIVRHHNFRLVKDMAEYSHIPVINAMTSENHPCEILTDLYSLSKIRTDFTKDKFLFVGAKGNIGNTWKAAADIFGFDFTHCCPKGCEINGAEISYHLIEAIQGKDVICTDSIPSNLKKQFEGYMVTKKLMDMANEGAVLNPCPPFFRGEEISADVINSDYFVGYEFKKNLVTVQQAILIFLMNDGV